MTTFQDKEVYNLLIDNMAYISIVERHGYKLTDHFNDNNGLIHCEYGPAIKWNDGSVEWWLNGVKYSFSKWCNITNKSKEEIFELVLIYG